MNRCELLEKLFPTMKNMGKEKIANSYLTHTAIPPAPCRERGILAVYVERKNNTAFSALSIRAGYTIMPTTMIPLKRIFIKRRI